MIKLERIPKIGKTPDYQDQQYGKIQLSSVELAKHVGKNLHICMYVYEDEIEYQNAMRRQILKKAD